MGTRWEANNRQAPRPPLQEHLDAGSHRARSSAAVDDASGWRWNDVFLKFVRKRLTRWLRKGDVVFMDNLRAHKRPEVIEAILAAGALPVYLPPYSPDLNPIEFWWADIKRQLRKLGIDSESDLLLAIRSLRKRLSHAGIAAWYRHLQAQLK
jgi:transposase